MHILRSLMALTLLAGLGVATTSHAQVPPNCEATTVSDPDRQVLACAFGVTIEMEAAAQMGFVDAPADAAPEIIDLNEGAALIEVEPGTARPQIRTPHAIAAVRGTVYVVDVSADKTSVFVIEGEVAVSHNADSDAAPVFLNAGDGVDVAPDQALDVVRWPAARAEALLARFGR